MKSVFTNENLSIIPTILQALDKAVENDNSDFIKIVLGPLEPKLVQDLLVQATSEQLAQLLEKKPDLLKMDEQGLLSLLDTAFEMCNIELATKILQKKPELLTQLIEKTKGLPNQTVLAQIASNAPEAVIDLFAQAIEKRNLELIGILLEQDIPVIQNYSKTHPDIMINLLKEAINQRNERLVMAVLTNNPELLDKKIKAEGKKPAVLLAKLQLWHLLYNIMGQHLAQNQNGDFHMALLWALKYGDSPIVIASNLDLICTSAETLDNEKNILHYAMFSNNPDVITPILNLQDKEVLQALVFNKNDSGENPITYAASNKKWAAVELHAKMHIPETVEEYCTGYFNQPKFF